MGTITLLKNNLLDKFFLIIIDKKFRFWKFPFQTIFSNGDNNPFEKKNFIRQILLNNYW